jgi:hypothetical protein
MNSFKEKLRNLINNPLGQNQSMNYEQNLNQSLLVTQRKINKNKNFFLERNAPSKSFQNTKNTFNQYAINDNFFQIDKKISVKNKNRKNNNLNFDNLSLNEISTNHKSKSNSYDINKHYKTLYNRSFINLNTNTYNINKTYLNYKNSNDFILNKNKYSKFIDMNNNLNGYNAIKSNSLIKKTKSFSVNNLIPKYNYLKLVNSQQRESNIKPNNFVNKNKLNYNSFSYKNNSDSKQMSENNLFINKEKNRISKRLRNKINSLIGDSEFENKTNTVNKIPRILTSELFQIDNKLCNDIAPIAKFVHLNTGKNQYEFKQNYFNFYSNRVINGNHRFNENTKSSKYLSYYKLTANNAGNKDRNFNKKYIVKDFITRGYQKY